MLTAAVATNSLLEQLNSSSRSRRGQGRRRREGRM
jgi:hypothetical protein